jgi:hypothetical protein
MLPMRSIHQPPDSILGLPLGRDWHDKSGEALYRRDPSLQSADLPISLVRTTTYKEGGEALQVVVHHQALMLPLYIFFLKWFWLRAHLNAKSVNRKGGRRMHHACIRVEECLAFDCLHNVPCWMESHLIPYEEVHDLTTQQRNLQSYLLQVTSFYGWI